MSKLKSGLMAPAKHQRVKMTAGGPNKGKLNKLGNKN